MASAYPAALDTTTTFPQTVEDDTDSTSGSDLGTSTTVGFLATWMRNTGSALINIETELGLTPKGTFSNVAARLVARQTVRKTADESFTTQTLTNVASMAFSVAASSDYWFRFFIPVTLGVARGVGVAVTCPASPTSIFYRVSIGNVTATTEGLGFGFASAALVSSAASATTNGIVTVEGTLANGATAGTLQLQLRQGTGATAVNVVAKKGGFGEMYTN
jgi:hypothetical protein